MAYSERILPQEFNAVERELETVERRGAETVPVPPRLLRTLLKHYAATAGVLDMPHTVNARLAWGGRYGRPRMAWDKPPETAPRA